MKNPDVIIVGAGVAGCAAAIKMANNGLNVVLIDRGMPIGSKNLSGGVLWGNDLGEIIPEWQKEAPIERYIVNKKVGFLSENDATVLDFHFDSWNEAPYAGVSVLRAPFDEWLAEKAKEAGVSVLSGITIDTLVFENDQVVGVSQNEEELRANLVIIAEGANPRLLLKHDLTYREDGRYDRSDYALGIKEVIALDQTVLEDRFLLEGDQGLAGEFIMGNLKGSNILAGGFFYTNKSSLSIGVVIHLDSLETKDRSYEVIERFKAHPYIKRLIKDGESIEYGSKLIPEMGYKKFPQPFGAGYLIVGDAAGFVFSNGITIQGMNYGIQSGLLAAETAIKSKQNGDYSLESLKNYKKLLDESYIMKDFKRLRNVKKMTKNPRLFQIYPDAINNAFKEILEENGDPKNNIIKILRKSMKESGAGLFTLMKDGLKARHL